MVIPPLSITTLIALSANAVVAKKATKKAAAREAVKKVTAVKKVAKTSATVKTDDENGENEVFAG